MLGLPPSKIHSLYMALTSVPITVVDLKSGEFLHVHTWLFGRLVGLKQFDLKQGSLSSSDQNLPIMAGSETMALFFTVAHTIDLCLITCQNISLFVTSYVTHH